MESFDMKVHCVLWYMQAWSTSLALTLILIWMKQLLHIPLVKHAVALNTQKSGKYNFKLSVLFCFSMGKL